MDVNINAEVKGYGSSVAPTTVEVEDRTKPQVQPVQQSSDSARAVLDEKRLHERDARERSLKKKPTREDLEGYIKEIQERLDAIGANLSLGLGTDQKTEAIIARITEKNSGKVVRQIPSEEVLALRAKLIELSGLLFDEKA